MKPLAPFVRHSRESGNLLGSLARAITACWVAAFAGMTMLVLVLGASLPAAAQDSLPPAPYAYTQLEDPVLEAKAQALMETLRRHGHRERHQQRQEQPRDHAPASLSLPSSIATSSSRMSPMCW